MTARGLKFPLLAFGLLVLTGLGAATSAWAGTCCAAPPTCCAPPTPPVPSPPPCCNQVNIPGVNVNVGANVVVNSNATAVAISNGSSQGAVFFGGGGSSYSVGESAGLIGALNVEGEAPQREAYQATRRTVKLVVIQAVCIDDQLIPHPASQVTPDKEIAESYEGELYRCIAGTHMQVTIADFNGQISFDHGHILTCNKGEALYRSADGEVACRPQRPARDCNERSLLRRFGAGIKIVKIITVETYTAYREQMVHTTSTSSNMYTDGGVGGIVH